MAKISQLPISRRRRAKMDAHNDAQARYRAKQKAAKIPSRANFSEAALTVVLMLLHNESTNPLHVLMRRTIEVQLASAGFDRAAASRRLDEMVARIQQIRATRRWRRECDAQLQEATNGGTEDEEVTE